MTTTTTEIVAYARVSTDAQAERNTIETQLKAIRAYCAKNGHTLTAEFCDDGVSGPGRARASASARRTQLR